MIDHYYVGFSNSVIKEVLSGVEDPLVCFTSILGLSVLHVDGGGEGSDDDSGLGLGDTGTTLFLLEVPGTSFTVKADSVVLLAVDSDSGSVS